MKKIININLASRVIPIEDTAYESLKQYLDSLRRYFANEEGRDEIISDIEGRIAEIFSDKIKKGAACITDDDVAGVITSMGRPEDFEESTAASSEHSSSGSEQASAAAAAIPGNKKFYRDENDKILGGVCSGLAAYLNIDPAVVRILFVLFSFGGGLGVLLYIILWIAVPAASVANYVKKRLYRDPDDKMIAGVCSGLANYFHIGVGWVRVIFLLPIILGIVSNMFGHWAFPFTVIGSSGFGSFFLAYIVLWIVVPPANTASEKLEMRGEKVDIHNIKNTIKSDLESFKSKAKDWGNEMKENISGVSSTISTEAGPAVKRSVSGFGRAIGILFKAFFFFIAGIIALALFGALIAMFVGGVGVLPFKHFFINGFWQNFYVWGTLLFFLAVPIIALITTIVRRLMGAKKPNKYLGYTFGVLWTLGWVCVILLAASFSRNFKARKGVQEEVSISQPASGKFLVTTEKNYSREYDYDEDNYWWSVKWDGDNPFYGKNGDSMMLKTVRINIVKSRDSLFHVYKVKLSRGNSIDAARTTAEKISFEINQTDSSLVLPRGFGISSENQFRNQQVLVVIEVPVGKRIEMDRTLYGFRWFNVNFNRRNGWDVDWDDEWNNSFGWDNNIDYIMTPSGLEKVRDLEPEELKKGNYRLKIKKEEAPDEENGTPTPPSLPKAPGSGDDNYRYDRNQKDSTKVKIDVNEKGQKTSVEIKTGSVDKEEGATEVSSVNPYNLILKMFQL